MQLYLSSPWGTEALEVCGREATGASLKQAVQVRVAAAAQHSRVAAAVRPRSCHAGYLARAPPARRCRRLRTP